MKRLWYILLLAVAPWFSLSCEKENYVGENEVKLEFSVDTVAFDTLFTTIGSTTRQVKVYNRSNRDVVIGSITLADGRQSPFRLNVDGDTSMVARNVEIMAGDSIFIFIQANLRYDTIHTLPFVVSDAIMFSNGQRLPVSAWGRNAVYHRAPAGSWVHVIDCAQWDHSRPHVFLDTAAIDSTFTLTLNAGEELYFANDAMLLVWRDGRLVVNGTADNPVVFTSLRHDGWYSFLPGQWSCVLFYNGSTGNVIDHAVVENGTGGLRAMYGAEVTVSNTVVRNMSDCGLIGQGSAMTGTNLLVYDCLTSFLVMDGGNYSFTGCTFADYWRYSTRSLQSVVLTNYILNSDGSVASTGDLVAANFTDCIIYGNYGEGEYLVAGVEGVLLNDSIVNCLIKGGAWDEDPQFVDVDNDDYHLSDGSPAAGIGYQYDN
jgi:hypothetical protein